VLVIILNRWNSNQTKIEITIFLIKMISNIKHKTCFLCRHLKVKIVSSVLAIQVSDEMETRYRNVIIVGNSLEARLIRCSAVYHVIRTTRTSTKYDYL